MGATIGASVANMSCCSQRRPIDALPKDLTKEAGRANEREYVSEPEKSR
jgi:hypothetical protein